MVEKPHPLLTADQQIEHMRANGVKFEIMNESDAKSYLRTNNNYFRLRSYRHGFERVSDGPNRGKYVNLDFAMLTDLATIDMHLRYQMLPITLEVEHFSKVLLLDAIEDHGEDGKLIVDDFLSTCNRKDDEGKIQNPILCEIDKGRNGPYTNGIIEHYSESGYPVWAFLEVISFGRFNHFWNFCAERYSDKDMKGCFYLLQAVKGLRNACCHNNCILNDMGAGIPSHKPQNAVRNAVRAAGISRQMMRSKLSNERLIQLTTTLYLHKEIASSKIREHRSKELKDFSVRVNRHSEYYKKCDQIRTGLDYITRIIGAWYPVQ